MRRPIADRHENTRVRPAPQLCAPPPAPNPPAAAAPTLLPAELALAIREISVEANDAALSHDLLVIEHYADGHYATRAIALLELMRRLAKRVRTLGDAPMTQKNGPGAGHSWLVSGELTTVVAALSGVAAVFDRLTDEWKALEDGAAK